MSDATQDRHRCRNPRCRTPFAVVYQRSLEDVPIPLTVACPRCGCFEKVMVTTGAVRQAQGTWIVPLGHAVASLEA